MDYQKKYLKYKKKYLDLKEQFGSGKCDDTCKKAKDQLGSFFSDKTEKAEKLKKFETYISNFTNENVLLLSKGIVNNSIIKQNILKTFTILDKFVNQYTDISKIKDKKEKETKTEELNMKTEKVIKILLPSTGYQFVEAYDRLIDMLVTKNIDDSYLFRLSEIKNTENSPDFSLFYNIVNLNYDVKYAYLFVESADAPYDKKTKSMIYLTKLKMLKNAGFNDVFIYSLLNKLVDCKKYEIKPNDVITADDIKDITPYVNSIKTYITVTDVKEKDCYVKNKEFLDTFIYILILQMVSIKQSSKLSDEEVFKQSMKVLTDINEKMVAVINNLKDSPIQNSKDKFISSLTAEIDHHLTNSDIKTLIQTILDKLNDMVKIQEDIKKLNISSKNLSLELLGIITTSTDKTCKRIIKIIQNVKNIVDIDEITKYIKVIAAYKDEDFDVFFNLITNTDIKINIENAVILLTMNIEKVSERYEKIKEIINIIKQKPELNIYTVFFLKNLKYYIQFNPVEVKEKQPSSRRNRGSSPRKSTMSDYERSMKTISDADKASKAKLIKVMTVEDYNKNIDKITTAEFIDFFNKFFIAFDLNNEKQKLLLLGIVARDEKHYDNIINITKELLNCKNKNPKITTNINYKEEFVTNIINISKNQYAGELIKSLQECKPEENYYEILQNFITNKQYEEDDLDDQYED
jgi:hypothetical protein